MMPDPDQHWTPARYIHAPARCWFCGAHIPRSKPGMRTGERGTKAFYNSILRCFECNDCRIEATRAYLAGQEPRTPALEACEACSYQRRDHQLPDEAPIFRLTPCGGCELNAVAGMHRTCPRCGHLEHRVRRNFLEGAQKAA